MEVSVQDLYVIIGQKDVELHILRRQVGQLQSELEQREPVKEDSMKDVVVDGV